MKIEKILVSQPKPSSDKSPYFDISKKYGVDITFRPFVKIEGLSAKEFRQQRINLANYTGVIFTSRTAIDHYFRLCEENRFAVPDTMRYFCTTESVALYLQKYIVYRKRKINFGLSGKLDDPQLIQALVKNNKESFLFPVSDVHNDQLAALDENSINYTKAVMYRTVSHDFKSDEPRDYDIILLFSPAGVASMLKNFPELTPDKQDIIIGTFGTKTSKALRDSGLRLDIEAPVDGITSMTAALDNFLADNKK